ncbi:hypothetical protein FRAHR75_80159 [Frankia sp. Hr75.2]|nr:hypothetical protein FRAHR75_80159 [Frankia sp. Hr75.2]
MDAGHNTFPAATWHATVDMQDTGAQRGRRGQTTMSSRITPTPAIRLEKERSVHDCRGVARLGRGASSGDDAGRAVPGCGADGAGLAPPDRRPG